MSIVVDGERSSMDRRASAFLKRTLSGSLRDADPSPMALLILAGVPVAAAAWAMMSPEQLLSNAMTWDLLFNLAGAWHLHLGHVPHVDFHEPVGALNFVLTAIGFRLVGVGPLAFLTGAALMTSVLFVAAFFAVLRRLPLAPAATFVTFVCLLALMPANLGERPDQYTMAMSYNRYCWGAFAILALILFVPPRNDRGHDGVDIALAALLLLAMFYLKITYFAAGLATVALATVLQPHIGRRWPAWAAVCALVITNALAPHSHPYLTDILGSASSGALRDNAMMHAKNFFAAAGEYAPYLAAMIVACWLWWTGRATPRLVLSLGLLFAVALFLLTQNTQAAGLPSTIVIILVLYDQLRVRFAGADDRELTPLLAALLVFPAFALATSAMTITGYHAKVNRTPALHVVESTQLRGLAVPAGQLGAFVNFSRGYAAAGTVGGAQEIAGTGKRSGVVSTKVRSLDPTFQVDDRMFAEFQSFLTQQKLRFTEEELVAQREELSRHIVEEVLRQAFGEAEARRRTTQWDPQVRKALEVVPKAAVLLKDPKRFMAEREAEGRMASSAAHPAAAAAAARQ